MNPKLNCKNSKNAKFVSIDTNTAETKEPSNACLCLIFEHLTISEKFKVERVSKQWQEASKSSLNSFTRLDDEFFNDEIYEMFEKYTLKFLKIIFASIFSKIGVSIKEVKINLGAICDIDWDIIFSSIGQFCENIEHFTLLGPVSEEDKFDDILKLIFSKNKNLMSVIIPGILITGKCLLSLPFHSLESIDIFAWEFTINPKYLKESFSKLKNLKCCRLKLNYEDIEIILKEICVCHNKITHLGIENKTLTIYTPPKFSTYFAKLENLKEIELINVELCKTDLLSLPMSSIEKLKLHSCRFSNQIHDKEEFFSCIDNFTNLKEIDVNIIGLPNDEFCEKLTKLSKLRSIKLRDCCNVTDTGIIKLCELPKLEVLHIADSYKITNVILPYLMHFKELRITKIREITTDGLCNFIEKVKNIDLLIIECLPSIISKNYGIKTVLNIEKLYETAVATSKLCNNKILKCKKFDSFIELKFLKFK